MEQKVTKKYQPQENEKVVAVSTTDEATADMEQQLAQRQDNRYSKDRFKDFQFD